MHEIENLKESSEAEGLYFLTHSSFGQLTVRLTVAKAARVERQSVLTIPTASIKLHVNTGSSSSEIPNRKEPPGPQNNVRQQVSPSENQVHQHLFRELVPFPHL